MYKTEELVPSDHDLGVTISRPLFIVNDLNGGKNLHLDTVRILESYKNKYADFLKYRIDILRDSISNRHNFKSDFIIYLKNNPDEFDRLSVELLSMY